MQNKTRKNGTIIFYTAISNAMSSMSNIISNHYNLKSIKKKAPSLVNKHNIDFFYGWLYDMGIKEINEFQYNDKKSTLEKRYGWFIL